MHAGHVQALPDGPAPEPDTEWLLYQALAGVWPDDMDVSDDAALKDLSGRFLPYVEKSLREAKNRTSWTEQNGDYEGAVKAYAERFFAPDNEGFRRDFAAVLKLFAAAGARNSLAQTLVKLMAPGIPDIYGGTEGWDFSLVDPDNRRPVDFSALARALDAPASGTLTKQRLIAAGLRLRAEVPELFARGDYLTLEVTGRRSGHAVAFARRHGGQVVMAVAARLTLDLDEAGWNDTAVRLPEGSETRWRDVLMGAEHRLNGAAPLADLLGSHHPVALLRREI
jgi:(1->4)-alpha-D-glucan 1-alpha-D-glucosylmutase